MDVDDGVMDVMSSGSIQRELPTMEMCAPCARTEVEVVMSTYAAGSKQLNTVSAVSVGNVTVGASGSTNAITPLVSSTMGVDVAFVTLFKFRCGEEFEFEGGDVII